MVVLDAFGLIAALTREPAGPEVEALLRDPSERVALTPVNLAEVIDIMVRVHGNTPEDVRDAISLLVNESMEIVAVDQEIGSLAGQLRSQHYRRDTRAISMADSICLAAAQRLAARLATADPALAATAREIGVDVVALMDSAGNRP